MINKDRYGIRILMAPFSRCLLFPKLSHEGRARRLGAAASAMFAVSFRGTGNRTGPLNGSLSTKGRTRPQCSGSAQMEGALSGVSADPAVGLGPGGVSGVRV
ncbi:hypothetical protein EVAR_58733_1 [Eumeta japonica]|uniref:Uncharacterized protein n=1 Tax=Eumeta variegata TaxID=151549 RepID=A0A4C1YXJ6_EUMVA|nr:hypothetical protein EVAR_58733_1 [Eumeta japonica]